MSTVTVSTFGASDVLEVIDLPLPEPGPGQVRISVEAAAVHPVDIATRAGALAAFLPERPFYPLGWDLAGTVDKLGEGVDDFAVGDSVIGLSDWFATLTGTQATHVVLDAAAISRPPAQASATEAATLPLNALTALQALDGLDLPEGATLAIVGAGGAVGGFAVQLAVQRGLQVYAVGSPGDEEFLRAAGATFVQRQDTAEALATTLLEVVPDGLDGVFDTALLGGALLAAVRDSGAYLTVFGPAAPESERGIRILAVSVTSNGEQLADLADLVDRGALTLRVAGTLPLKDVARAHEAVAAGGVRGRIVLVP